MKTFTYLKGFLSLFLFVLLCANSTKAQTVTTSANPVNVNRSVSSTSVLTATISGATFVTATWGDPGSGVSVGLTTLSGGNTVATATATFSANQTSTFTLTYTRTGSGSTFTTTVTVSAVQLTITPSTTQNDDQGDFENFSSTPTGFPGSGAYTYSWQVTPNTGISFTNSTNSTSATPQITFGSAGSFAVSVTQSRGGVTVTSASTTVNITAPVVTNSPSATQNIDAGDFVNFSSNPTHFTTNGGGGYTYNWQISPMTGVSFINSTSNTSSTPRIQFGSAGTFAVTVTQTRNGYSATSVATTVNVAAATIAISPSTTQSVLAGGSINFTATPGVFGGSGNFNYTWTAAGATISGSNPESDGSTNPKTITFPSAGSYSVSVSATRGGASATSSTTTVNAFSVSAGADELIPGSTAPLNGSASGPGSITYAWTRISGPNTPTLTNGTSANASLSGLIDGTYIYRLTINGVATLFDEVTITVITGGNLWATSSSGSQISSFAVNNGSYISGPTNIFAPLGGSTAALGRSDKPGLNTGYFYWLPNTGGNGVVDVYGASAAGNDRTLIGSFDVNGAGDNNDMGFVRLGMGPDGTGWLLAKENNTDKVFLAKFTPNGVAPVTITVVDDDVTMSGGAGSTFVNGDICFSGTGTMFALANNGSGVTQIFTGTPNGSSTTLTKKWDLRDETNAPFTGSVNGVAFDAVGSLYISTAEGLFYIDQATVNSANGTVLCSLVQAQTGLQDLASNFFPQQTTLPVELISFSGSLRANIVTLNWETENEISFDHFEIERSSNGSQYSKIASKASLQSGGRSSYQSIDDLSSVSGNVFYYRLKIVDIDSKFKYSNVILVRKDQSNIKGLALNPNPVIGGMATARFTADANLNVSFRVLDMSGKEILRQQAKVYEGSNSISINNLDRLQPGVYMLQMDNGSSVQSTKFTVAR